MRKIVQLIKISPVLLATFLLGKLFGLTGPIHQAGPLEMALVLPTSGVVPDSTTWIGWWIKREENWHTYWEHPGNVGLTPTLEWELPDGITISNLQYPFPKRVQMAGVKAYGHHGETLYISQLHIPNLPLGTKLKLRAKARWMACSNVCLPQFSELSLALIVQDESLPDEKWNSRFSEFLMHRPVPVPEKWKLQATELGQFTKLSVTNHQLLAGEEVYLFGGDYLVCSDSEQRLRATDSGFEILVPKPVWPEENPSHLNGLLRIGGTENSYRYYPLNVPLN